MSFPLISLMDTCNPPAIVIRTPFNSNAGDAQDDSIPDGCEDSIVTGAMAGNPNPASWRLDLDMTNDRSRI